MIRSARRRSLTLLTGLLAAACVAAAAASAGRAAGTPSSLSRLGNISQYTYTLVTSGQKAEMITVHVHSPTNYEFSYGPMLTRVIGADAWVDLGGHWDKIASPTNQMMFGKFAQQVQGLMRVTGARLVAQGSCSETGRHGHQYRIVAATHTLEAIICVDANTGVLLRARVGISGQAALTEDVRLTQYGHVPAFTPPR